LCIGSFGKENGGVIVGVKIRAITDTLFDEPDEFVMLYAIAICQKSW
jgi:hypothetical protein